MKSIKLKDNIEGLFSGASFDICLGLFISILNIDF